MADLQMCPNCFEMKYKNGRCQACGWREGDIREDPNILPVGEVLNGRYILGKAFGRGGFGITYLACDLRHGDLCAVKEYFPGRLAHREMGNASVRYSYSNEGDYLYGKKQFFREAQTLYTLKGIRSVVEVKEYFEKNNTAYMTMEYVRGKNLKECVLQEAALPSAERVKNYLIDLLLTLKEVHQFQLLHRDISPQNIIVQPDGSLKLIDFGAARFVMNERSRSLSVVLKPGYAPPEQYSSRGEQGPWTDLYALGATLYFFATKQTVQDAMDRLEKDEVIPIGELRPDIPESVGYIIDHCLKLNSKDRFRSTDEALEILHRERKSFDLAVGEIFRYWKQYIGERQIHWLEDIRGVMTLQVQGEDGIWKEVKMEDQKEVSIRRYKGGMMQTQIDQEKGDIILIKQRQKYYARAIGQASVRFHKGALLKPGLTYLIPPKQEMEWGRMRLRVIKKRL